MNSKNRPHGFGKYVLPNEYTYEGNWAHGKRQGHGIATYKNGAIYDGEWRQGRRHGLGTAKSPMGEDIIYTGGWQFDHKEGVGSEMRKNGTCIYTGTFKNDMYVGRGVLRLAGNRGVYAGDFEDDLPSGFGLIISPNGDISYGTFKNGVLNGLGLFKSRLEKKSYMRTWKQGHVVGGRGVEVVEENAATERTISNLLQMARKISYHKCSLRLNY